ncbi:Alpha/Beta hydrolase protein [Xylaria sp. CBS 124048]|nr:Alpha/Beta hydrolase protein [Xylaria sp. CBS 124048]
MEKIQLGQSSHLKSLEECAPIGNISASPAPRSWRSRAAAHGRSWRYIYLLLLLAFYYSSRPFLRQDFPSRVPAQNEQSLSGSTESTELRTEWLDITPSEKLEWHPCFGAYGPNLQCARLTVPMDYSRPLNESAEHPKVNLALVMVMGTGRTEDPSTYADAPLLVNPGGPGGSGVKFVQSRAKSFPQLVGDQHDIIGFDPRGVGASTPRADCFSSPDGSDGASERHIAYLNRLTWLTGEQGSGLTNSSDVALTLLNARARALGQLCQRMDKSQGKNSILRHMTTPNSAWDMLSIISAWDEWKSSGSKIQHEQRSEPEPSPDGNPTSDDRPQSQTSLRGKLVYWGFSYGTLLGATFASMFPDQVGRVVLDGVVHADRYVNPMWVKSIVDADTIWDHFFEYCAEKGSPCSFYRPGDSSQDIRRRFDKILSSLEEQPAIILRPDTNVPALVTASDVKKSVFFGGLYAPISGFPVIAELLDHAVKGTLGEIAKGPAMPSFCGNLTLPVWPDDAIEAIACSDKRYRIDENATALQSRFEKAASYSWFADVWFGAGPNLGCNGWPIKSKDTPMQWDEHPVHEPELIETNFPILFLSNSLDPVTPLADALYMTRRFANASIVEQKALGHCSISCVSSCTIRHLRAYLNDGVVPPPPKFESNTGHEGQWPTCNCLETPWTSLAYAAESDRPMLTTSHMQAYNELRAQFAVSIISQQLESNPLKTYLLERTGITASTYLK